MSLINKMLQDLDARRSEVTGSGVLGSQIRVVARRRHNQLVWWVAAGLAVVLAVVLVWVFLLHPTSQTSEIRAGKQPTLPVKPAPVQAPATQLNNEAKVKKEAAPLSKSVEPAAPTAEEKTEKNNPLLAVNKIPEIPAAVPKLPPVPEKTSKLARPNLPTPEEMARAERHASPPAVSKAPRSFEPIVPQGLKQPTSNVPQRADTEYRKALVLREQGKTTEAMSSLEQALQLDPQHSAARQVLIGMLIEARRQEDALRRAQEGLDIDPAQSGLAMIASRLQLEKGNLKPAIETLERSLRYALDRPDYQAFLAALLQRDGRNKDAVEHYLVAVRQSPQNGVWWMGLGISLQADDRLPEAKEAFGRAKDSGTLSPELLAFVDSKLKQLPR